MGSKRTKAAAAFLAGPKPITGALAPLASELGPHLTSAGYGAAPASGSMGRATLVGNMSVPQGWTQAAPEIRNVAQALSTELASAPEAALAGGEGNIFGQMALSSRPDGPLPPPRPARSAVPRWRRH